MANNYVANRYAYHRTNIVSTMQNGAEQANNIAQGIAAKTGDAVTAANKALAVMNASVERQSYYLSYLDTFRLIAIFFIAVIPFVMFLRVKKKSAAEQAAAMKAAAESH
jgi:DHA2 family multidrug resistance protein